MTIHELRPPETLQERIAREQYDIEHHTTPADLAAQDARSNQLDDLVSRNVFIGSIWARGLDYGQSIHQAPMLWLPYMWSYDSGRRSVLIKEFQLVEPGKPTKITGSEDLENGRELLFGIFQTMAMRGSVMLFSCPETPVVDNRFGSVANFTGPLHVR
jgi:hypothetical protein